MKQWTIALAAILALGAGAGAAAPQVEIELNKLEPVDGACRAYLVFRNATQSAFTTLKLDLVLFGQDGVIARRLALEAAPLDAGKVSVKLFDIAGLPCPALGQILLNDVVACRDQSGERQDCAALARPQAKGTVSFIK